jgi:hypothetical protein
VLFHFVAPGEMFGTPAVFLRTSYPADTLAITDCVDSLDFVEQALNQIALAIKGEIGFPLNGQWSIAQLGNRLNDDTPYDQTASTAASFCDRKPANNGIERIIEVAIAQARRCCSAHRSSLADIAQIASIPGFDGAPRRGAPSDR